ncbi:hypothetical protein [Dactylosporangium sp. CA-233914]|uniref:hypothetical protein n=1 Tax=Dactylosporangium sp. CA-233914 TaxID=3239934 RepID=UPI003D9030BD
MNDSRLRVFGDNLDLIGPPAALRALATSLREAGAAVEVPIRNGAVAQERTEGPLAIELRGAPPTLHLTGADDALKEFWTALEAVAAETETAEPGAGAAPHRHVGPLVITGDAADPLAGLL